MKESMLKCSSVKLFQLGLIPSGTHWEMLVTTSKVQPRISSIAEQFSKQLRELEID